jgi:hypothetical protein
LRPARVARPIAAPQVFKVQERLFLHFPGMDRPDAPTLGAAAADEARRRDQRVRTLLSGKLVFGVHGLTADCTIRNLSASGAKLQTSLAATLPREVWLIVVKQGRAYRSTIAWRRGEELGVHFEAEHDLARDNDPDLAIVRRVWREVAVR